MKTIVGIAGAIIFFLEVFVIVKLFLSLPDGVDALIFWLFVAIAITLIHLIVLSILIYSIIQKWNILATIGISIVYLLILGAFFISSIGYNLKTIEKRATGDDYEIYQQESTLTAISGNNAAMKKYQKIIDDTNDINVITKWRKVINDLKTENKNLYTNGSVQTNKNIEINPFALMSSKIGWKKEFVISWFLASIWFILEVGLWVCVILEMLILLGKFKTKNIIEKPKPEKVKKEKFNIREFVHGNKELMIDFINSFIVDGEIVSDRVVNKSGKINIYKCRKCRYSLQEIEVDGKTLIESSQGKSKANYTKEEMIDVINRM